MYYNYFRGGIYWWQDRVGDLQLDILTMRYILVGQYQAEAKSKG
jgi:hypothetical protein